LLDRILARCEPPSARTYLVGDTIGPQRMDGREVQLVSPSGGRTGAVAHEPGFYRGAGEGRQVFAVNLSVRESDLQSMPAAKLERALQAFLSIPDGAADAGRREAVRGRTPVWRLIGSVLLGLLACEMVAANVIKR
ncbi:MAG: hypothetical protein HQ559_04290, partial [Lentisphaerae bacterium]|nr:hypothetical protein [Lentisphaerota bacterium]